MINSVSPIMKRVEPILLILIDTSTYSYSIEQLPILLTLPISYSIEQLPILLTLQLL
jgi:hypothetical protein